MTETQYFQQFSGEPTLSPGEMGILHFVRSNGPTTPVMMRAFNEGVSAEFEALAAEGFLERRDYYGLGLRLHECWAFYLTRKGYDITGFEVLT